MNLEEFHNTLDYLKFWQMVQRYDPDGQLIHQFPKPSFETVEKLIKARTIRSYVERNPNLDKTTFSTLVEKYREYMKFLLVTFAKYQGYRLRKLGEHEYEFKFIRPHVSTDKRHYDYGTNSPSQSLSSSPSPSPSPSQSTPSSPSTPPTTRKPYRNTRDNRETINSSPSPSPSSPKRSSSSTHLPSKLPSPPNQSSPRPHSPHSPSNSKIPQKSKVIKVRNFSKVRRVRSKHLSTRTHRHKKLTRHTDHIDYDQKSSSSDSSHLENKFKEEQEEDEHPEEKKREFNEMDPQMTFEYVGGEHSEDTDNGQMKEEMKEKMKEKIQSKHSNITKVTSTSTSTPSQSAKSVVLNAIDQASSSQPPVLSPLDLFESEEDRNLHLQQSSQQPSHAQEMSVSSLQQNSDATYDSRQKSSSPEPVFVDLDSVSDFDPDAKQTHHEINSISERETMANVGKKMSMEQQETHSKDTLVNLKQEDMNDQQQSQQMQQGESDQHQHTNLIKDSDGPDLAEDLFVSFF